MPLRSKVDFDFLKSEAALGATFIQVADIQAHDHPERSARSLAKADEAARTIRKFLAEFTGFTDEELEYLERRCAAIEASIRAYREHSSLKGKAE